MTDARIADGLGATLGATRCSRAIVRGRMTQGEAAEVIGISRVKLNQYLNGEGRPSLETAIRIEDAAGIGIRSWLIAEAAPKDREAAQVNETIMDAATGVIR
jgi:transcriptional regulator with XRE-family HTH domain